MGFEFFKGLASGLAMNVTLFIHFFLGGGFEKITFMVFTCLN